MPQTTADSPTFDSIESAIQDIADGRMVIVTDDENRENEGDLIMAASKATPEAISTMIRYCSGIICVPMLIPQLQALGIHAMVADNKDSYRTDFTVTVDAAEGITTGISAYDRALTINILGNPKSKPSSLVQPGHVFPLRAKSGGVLERAGHTEAAVDLATLAGLHPSGVLCELVNDDGTVARLPELIKYKEKFGIKLISIADLIEYRHKRERLVSLVGKELFESEFGTFTLHIFRSHVDNRQHYALSKGDLDESPTLVRVHSENIISDAFRGTMIGNYRGLTGALQMISESGHGVLVYISQPNGGILFDSADSVEEGMRPSKMDFRDYGAGAQILSLLGLQKIRLMTSTQRNVVALDGYDLEITEFVDCNPTVND
ncbi:MAG: 3,4-dihydroxy-2-butanone-4-phosphate synthase [Verrucomicrobiota bacterium]